MIYAIFTLFTLLFHPLSAIETLDQQLEENIHYDPVGPNSVGYIKIEDHSTQINQSTWLYVKKALDYYKEHKPIFLILELNTPGGEVFAAQKISDALIEMDTQYGVPVVAFINNWAISAGAMIAYSSRFIAIVKDASMGAAEPITTGESGKTEPASEKVNSAIRADFGNRAHFFDRNANIAEAMVDKDIILVWRNGQVVRLENESQIKFEGADPDTVITLKGKLLTLNSQQMMDYGVADILLAPTRLPQITEMEKEKGTWPADKMLLFTYPFFKKIPQTFIDEYQMDWKTRFFLFLTTPVVSSILFLGLLIGFYLEMSSPGFGLPGSIAFLCLFLIILSNFSLEIANWLEVIFLVTGIAILFVELYVLPTFGILGFIGIVFCFIGLIGMMIPNVESVTFDFDSKSFNAAGEVVLQRIAWYCGTLVLASAIILVLSRFVTPRFSPLRRIVLSGNEQFSKEGYSAGLEPEAAPETGAKGEAFTTLRPSGKVWINDHIYDAISQNGLIERGERIIVKGIEGANLLVVPEEEI